MLSLSNNGNYLLILLIGVMIIGFIFMKSISQTSDKQYMAKLERRQMEKIIEKQEKILRNLQDKIDTKFKKQKYVTVENMENISDKHKEVEEVKKQKNNNINRTIEVEGHDDIQIDHDIRNIRVLDDNRFDPVYVRDRQVLDDKLYPPLGRTDRPQFDLLMNFVKNQPDMFNTYTRGPPDTFRPLGYLTKKGTDNSLNPNDTLILFGRSKYPNSDIGEFYVTTSNKISDIKIPLDNNNSNIRRIYDIPNEVIIDCHMIKGTYNCTELPKPDISTQPYL